MSVHNLIKTGAVELDGALLSEVSARLRGRGAPVFLLALCVRAGVVSLAVFRTINLLQQCLIEMPCAARADMVLSEGIHILGSTEHNIFSPSATKHGGRKRADTKAVVAFTSVENPDATRMRRSVSIRFSTWEQKEDTFDLFLLGDHGLAPDHLLLFQAQSVIDTTGTIAFRARIDRTTLEDIQRMENTLSAQSKNVSVVAGEGGVVFRYQKAVDAEGNVREDLVTRVVADIFDPSASAVRFSRFAQRIPGRPDEIVLWILVLGDTATSVEQPRALQVTGYVFVQATYPSGANEVARFAYSESTLTFFLNGRERGEVVDEMERSAEQFGRRMERYKRSRPMKRGEADGKPDDPPAKSMRIEPSEGI